VGAARLIRKRFHGGTEASDSEHGNAVAALLAGSSQTTNGLLPHSVLVAADVFSPQKDGRMITSAAAIAEGVDWALSHNVTVINMSLAGPDNRLLQKVMATARRKGVTVVASAGNNGPRAAPAFPAAYPEVIAVTAVDTRRRLYADANRGPHIALAAPGVNVFTPTAGAGSYRTGTSFAAPFVTASVAVLQAKGMKKPDEIGEELRRSAVDLGTKGRDPLYGWGLLKAPSKCP
jgi:subtilisin family serine protease